jgi:hypothetical protein
MEDPNGGVGDLLSIMSTTSADTSPTVVVVVGTNTDATGFKELAKVAVEDSMDSRGGAWYFVLLATDAVVFCAFAGGSLEGGYCAWETNWIWRVGCFALGLLFEGSSTRKAP